MIMHVSRESVSNGDDYDRVASLEYKEDEMLSSFLKSKVAEYLPYTNGLTVWAIYMNSDERQNTAERENPEKKVAFIRMNGNRCVKVEIKGSNRAVSSLETDKIYCAVYR
ncbi:hypothetical protein SAMN02910275_01558 [Butyrivibrio sp. INlla18]|uniref:hypothetical protein n=1 Tax=Butyrivibrio sp. INlla18 TaxID=1520806 RepID=UPI00087F9DED|nr:hypothetical protein [Butyrivibrio sp. INlla18]SDA60884.1 hypothetical protein SAMN02910275_01558 [Butyrivibrio sp. INlla18]